MELHMMAVRHDGWTEHGIDPKRPRASLMERLGVKHAKRMFVDSTDGKARHIGYVIGGGWWTLYRVGPWEGERA